jgi:threonine/homoserine/homoserine lactone efflux protein
MMMHGLANPKFLIFLVLMTRAMAKSTNHEVPGEAFFFILLLFAVIVQWCTINFNHIRGGSRSLPDGPHGSLTGYDAAVRR